MPPSAGRVRDAVVPAALADRRGAGHDSPAHPVPLGRRRQPFAVYNVSLRRPARVALIMAGLHQIAIVGYYLLWVSTYPFWAVWLVALTELAAVVAWGMYLRARGELVD
jgi:hypothetical protein